MAPPVYYVGTPEEVAHHARPLAEAFDLRIVAPDEVVRLAQPGEVCIFFNEYFPRFRDACLSVKAKGCATLYAIDGILEWRNSWELPLSGTCCLWVMRPVLSHKIACVGRSQVRILESWGNLGQCEVVGVPRFDSLVGRQPRKRATSEPFRILVMSPKCPGFTPEQIAVSTQSFRDLKHWFDEHPNLDSTPIQPIWRLTAGLEHELGIANELRETSGVDLAAVLQTVDAVITMPSTAMLEAMLQRLPVALLDYHNRPHYVPAAWQITSAEHFDQVLPELFRPSPDRLLYQQSILHDALECHSPAAPRLIELVTQMQSHAKCCLAHGERLRFPARILSDSQHGHHLPETGLDWNELFPPGDARARGTGRGWIDADAVAAELVVEGGPAMELRTVTAPHDVRIDQWLQVVEEAAANRRADVEAVAAPLRMELAMARQEIRRLRLVERQTLPAKLSRVQAKLRKLITGRPKSDNGPREAA